MSERQEDFIEQRSKVRSVISWPMNVAFGLFAFKPVQNLTNFIARSVFTITGMVPLLTTYDLNNNIENSMRLTRYRNVADDVL